MDYRIYPPEQLIEDGIADLPLSKSMLNRRMVIEALTPGCPEGSLLYSGTGGDGPEIRDIAVIRAALRQMLCQASKNLGAAALTPWLSEISNLAMSNIAKRRPNAELLNGEHRHGLWPSC